MVVAPPSVMWPDSTRRVAGGWERFVAVSTKARGCRGLGEPLGISWSDGTEMMEEPEWLGRAGLLSRRFMSRWSMASLSKLAAEDLREPGTDAT